VLVSSYITPKARKGGASGIEGRGLAPVAPIAVNELVAIKGGHIVTTSALQSLPERLQNSEIQIADGFHLAAPSSTAVQPAVADTNPADAPYPLWNAATNYPAGYKVVENGEIYQAKWYNSGDDPSTQVQFSYQTPWELLGPVVPGDHASAVATLPAGTYPAWSQNTQYQSGTKVLFQGRPYQAKWVNQGVSPATESTDPSGSAWKALYSIPGEPSGAPALGATSGGTPTASASPSPGA
jgi:chitodextrinase